MPPARSKKWDAKPRSIVLKTRGARSPPKRIGSSFSSARSSRNPRSAERWRACPAEARAIHERWRACPPKLACFASEGGNASGTAPLPSFRVRIQQEEDIVWNKEEVRGKVDQAKGRAKKAAGDLSNDERLRNEGTEDEAAGRVEEAVGKGRRKVGEAISDLGKKVGR